MSLTSTAKRAVQTLIGEIGNTRLGRVINEAAVAAAAGATQTIRHDGTELTFAVPNALNRFRADTFSTKEEETLGWIDGFPVGSVLWDIGANVGYYSCYAAARRGCRVFAFEPSVFNLETLARNVALNDLSDLVTIVPLAVAEDVQIGTLNLTSTDHGAALSTFGQDFGHDGQPMEAVFRYSTLGISLPVAASMGLDQPEFIKLDVDGLEHLILRGAGDVLVHTKSVLVEVNEAFEDQHTEVTRSLTEAGLKFVESRRWDRAVDGPFDRTYNQIWRRPNNPFPLRAPDAGT